jgi:predicted ATPase
MLWHDFKSISNKAAARKGAHMENRIKTAIQKITLNDHTFSGVSFEPTLINFFFGNNGTGKSTLAKNI